MAQHRQDHVELGAMDEQGRPEEPGGEMGQHGLNSYETLTTIVVTSFPHELQVMP